MNVKSFFDKDTSTLTYVVFDKITKDCLVIDPVLNFDLEESTFSTQSIDQVYKFIKKNNFNLHMILETHAHADHLSGAQFMKDKFPKSKLAIGENIKSVQKTFKHIFNFKNFNENGLQFDLLLKDNSVCSVGSFKIKTLFTPGHTPACVSYLINEKIIFTGDVLLMHDYGTGRCDFPGGSSEQMYNSIKKKLYTLPDNVKVFVGHDYMPNGRKLEYKSTIGIQKKLNPHINSITQKKQFIKNRDSRDKTLKSPRLLLQSLQVNIDAGKLPVKEQNKQRYLKIPINQK